MIEAEDVLECVVEKLKVGLSNMKMPAQSIAITVDERVPPGAGEEYIAVYPTDYGNIHPPPSITKRIAFSFTVGITRRVVGMPNEMAGRTVLTYDDDLVSRLKPAMYKRAGEIAEVLLDADGWTLLNTINSKITSGFFLIPFGFSSISSPRKVDHDHFDIEEDPDNPPPRYVGLLLEIEFSGAEYFNASNPPTP